MRFISGLQVYAAGNSVPGAFFHTPAQIAEVQLREVQAQRLGRVAASAQDRLEASGGHYDIFEFDKFAAARGLTLRQRMETKRLISERGLTLEQALAKQRIA